MTYSNEAEAMAIHMQHVTKTLEELEDQYNDITSLYDLAGELVETVDSQFITNQEMQWDIVEPLVSEIGEATDILTEEYITIAEAIKKRGSGNVNKTRIESAFRRIYTTLNEYRQRVRDINKQAHNAIQNIADPIVDKLERAIDHVVAIFFEFVQLSLASIMHKTQLDQLKARETQVALALHKMSMQAQQ